MSAKNTEINVSKKELAQLTGKSLNTIYKHMAVSGLKEVEKGKYNKAEALAYLKECASRSYAVKAPKGSVREAMAMIKLQSAKLDLDVKKGKLLDREEVNRKFAQCGQMVLSAMMALPGAISKDLEGKKATKINDILQAEIRQALEFLNER